MGFCPLTKPAVRADDQGMENTYRVGSVIRYKNRTVRVELKESEIKNGEPGFSGQVISGPEAGMDVWGYDVQISQVVTF